MTDEEARALAERAARELQGSPRLIGSLGEEFEGAENNTAFCERLDELVFCCVRCDWWFEQSEMAEDCGDEWICEECADD